MLQTFRAIIVEWKLTRARSPFNWVGHTPDYGGLRRVDSVLQAPSLNLINQFGLRHLLNSQICEPCPQHCYAGVSLPW